MTARHAVRRRADGTVLSTKLSKRVGYALGFLLLAAAMAVGFDPARDLSPARAPFTVLYLVLLLACLAACLTTHVLVAEPGKRTLRSELRIAGLLVRANERPVPEGSEVSIRRLTPERASYALELGLPGSAELLDSSSWLRELEPMGKHVADALGLPFRSER